MLTSLICLFLRIPLCRIVHGLCFFTANVSLIRRINYFNFHINDLMWPRTYFPITIHCKFRVGRMGCLKARVTSISIGHILFTTFSALTRTVNWPKRQDSRFILLVERKPGLKLDGSLVLIDFFFSSLTLGDIVQHAFLIQDRLLYGIIIYCYMLDTILSLYNRSIWKLDTITVLTLPNYFFCVFNPGRNELKLHFIICLQSFSPIM